MALMEIWVHEICVGEDVCKKILRIFHSENYVRIWAHIFSKITKIYKISFQMIFENISAYANVHKPKFLVQVLFLIFDKNMKSDFLNANFLIFSWN